MEVLRTLGLARWIAGAGRPEEAFGAAADVLSRMAAPAGSRQNREYHVKKRAEDGAALEAATGRSRRRSPPSAPCPRPAR